MNCNNITEVLESCPNDSICDCVEGIFGSSSWITILLVGIIALIILICLILTQEDMKKL